MRGATVLRSLVASSARSMAAAVMGDARLIADSQVRSPATTDAAVAASTTGDFDELAASYANANALRSELSTAQGLIDTLKARVADHEAKDMKMVGELSNAAAALEQSLLGSAVKQKALEEKMAAEKQRSSQLIDELRKAEEQSLAKLAAVQATLVSMSGRESAVAAAVATCLAEQLAAVERENASLRRTIELQYLAAKGLGIVRDCLGVPHLS